MGWMKPMFRWIAVFTLVVAGGRVGAQVLYDADAATLPTGQGWSFLAIPALAQETRVAGGAQLDTWALDGISAGWSRLSPVMLDRERGFLLSLELELLDEAHVSPNRAGFSLVVLGSDRKGIEIGFWTNRVWAQSDFPMFTQAEGAEVAVAGGRRRIGLTMTGDDYTAWIDDAVVLRGPVRDYTPFVGPIDPYETPNFIFVGDNTGSARARVRLHRVQLSLAPEALPELKAGPTEDGRLELRWSNAERWPGWKVEALDSLPAGRWEGIELPRTMEDGDEVIRVPLDREQRWFRLR